MQRKLHTNGCIELASALNNLGYVLLHQDNLAEAETILRETVAMKGRLPANEPAERSLSLNNLAKVFQLEGKLTEAETTYREALARQRKRHGDDHLEVADALNNLGYVLAQQHKLAEARPLADEAVAIFLRHPAQAGSSKLNDALRLLLTDLGDTAALGKLDLIRQRNAKPMPSPPPEPPAR